MAGLLSIEDRLDEILRQGQVQDGIRRSEVELLSLASPLTVQNFWVTTAGRYRFLIASVRSPSAHDVSATNAEQSLSLACGIRYNRKRQFQECINWRGFVVKNHSEAAATHDASTSPNELYRLVLNLDAALRDPTIYKLLLESSETMNRRSFGRNVTNGWDESLRDARKSATNLRLICAELIDTADKT